MIKDLPLGKFAGRPELGKLAEPDRNEEAFEEYRSNKSAHTLRRQANDLTLFADYLKDKIDARYAGNLSGNPQAWAGVTWQAVVGFQRWQIAYGYAISSINVRISTVRTYSRLATITGVMDVGEYAFIMGIRGYSEEKAKEIDEARDFHGEGTRIGAKKRQAVTLTAENAQSLKEWTDTPRGRRDTLLMCLLLDHGLRVGEIAKLKVEDFDLPGGTFKAYRPQTQSKKIFRMTRDTLAAATAYLTDDAKPGRLLRGSRKSGKLTGTMSKRAISQRVRVLGKKTGVERLSPSDCRDHWAMQMAQNGASLEKLRELGGWVGLAGPARYIAQTSVEETV